MRATLQRLNQQLYRWPATFHINTKLAKQLAKRPRGDWRDEDGRIEWAHAEALAFASLLVEGVPIRLTGQDTVRGTFSQRHQTLWDAKTGAAYTPIQHLEGARAAFELHNSPLSEYATVGFEYGYAVTAPGGAGAVGGAVRRLRQRGRDHHRPVHHRRACQVAADLAPDPAAAPWLRGIRSGALLRPPERFLALGAEGNIRVVYPTTPAQYFHLLRRQARHADLRPLIVMTPKSLLRLPEAASRPDELSTGAFASVLDDPARDR